MLVYLSGRIEFADDLGKSWRHRLRPFLEKVLGHEVYDPAEDGKKNLTDEEATNFRSWKLSNPDGFRRAVRKIIDWDLDLIEKQVDYVVCYWDDQASRGAGTQAEVTVAYRKRIPIYLVTDLPINEISGWILSCAEHTFSSFDDLKAFLAATYSQSSIKQHVTATIPNNQ